MKNFEQVKADTLAHYDRMIAWVEFQPEWDLPCASDMIEAIEECWFVFDCPMCMSTNRICGICPIKLSTGYRGCVGTPWTDMAHSENWHEWLIHAKRERAFIESLQDKENEHL